MTLYLLNVIDMLIKSQNICCINSYNQGTGYQKRYSDGWG